MLKNKSSKVNGCEGNGTANEIVVDTGTVIICDDIDEYLVRDIMVALPRMIANCKKNKWPLDIKINSTGGNLMDAQAIVTELLRCKVPVHIDIVGYAFSGASMLSLAGDKVVMSKLGLWMTHYPSWNNDDPSYYSHKKTTEMTCEHYERIMTFLLRKTKLNLKKLQEKSIKNDWFITPKECLSLGLVHRLY